MHDLVLVLVLQVGVLLLLGRFAPGSRDEKRESRPLFPHSSQPSWEGAQRMIEREYGASVCSEEDER
jgi:hypothetical protein